MMLTQCPKCATAFRVSAAQLKLKQGRVRCGQCRQVFDALASLVDAPPPTSSEVPDPAEQATPADASPPAEPPQPTAAAEAGATPAFLSRDVPEEAAEQPWPGYDDAAYAAPLDVRPKSSHPWLWGSAALVAALLLLLQALLHFRTELSLLLPDARPLLSQASALFGLDLPLPQKVDMLGIESSDLHPGSGSQLILVALLKNRAPFPQTYPHLELTLTDLGEQLLLRKVLAPADFLPPGVDAAAGFAANAELALHLSLEASVAGAAGYRIYVFYP